MDSQSEDNETTGSWWRPGDGEPRVSERVRYAVVGLGATAQGAILPAFAHARSNSELVALVSGDAEKLQLLGRKYRIKNLYDYHGYEDCLASGDIDAVYVALPNNQHREFTVRAARAGIHVLCEMPMAVDAEECEAMRAACRATNVKLMIGYRLHFEEANLRAIQLARSGRLGDLRTFHSSFAMPASPTPTLGGTLRFDGEVSGGPLLDLGIYCIHAARHFFESEPVDVAAISMRGKRDSRFADGEETVSAILRFPGDRVATFTSSRRATDASYFELHGTEGFLRLEQAYSYSKPMLLRASVKGRTRDKAFRKRDQFAPELQYFSECVLDGSEPEPSGLQGANDIRIVEAIRRAARSGQVTPVDVAPDLTTALSPREMSMGARTDGFAHVAGPQV